MKHLYLFLVLLLLSSSVFGIGAITGTTNICVGNTSTMSDTSAGGTWSSSNIACASIGTSSGIVTGVSLGTSMITYRVGSAYSTIMVTVSNPVSAGSILGLSTLCQGTDIVLSETTTGGEWSSSNTGVATIDTGGLLSGINGGTATISYTVSGCAIISATTVIVVNPKPLFSRRNHICVDNFDTLIVYPPGGSWSSSNIGIISLDSIRGIAHGITTGTSTLFYTSIAGCSNSETLFVDTLPRVASITGNDVLFYTNIETLSDSVTGGIWSSSDELLAIVGSTSGIVQGIYGGNVVITYTIANTCGVSFATFGIFLYFEAVKPLSYNYGSFQIFPNPVADILTIHWASQFKGLAWVTITDMLGREVFESKFLMDADEGDKELGLTGLPDGLYMVTIKTDYMSYNSKFVKLKR